MKNKKILLIVLLSLAVSLGAAYISLYCIYPANTQKYTWLTIDYICNKPLPVVGVSILVLAVFLFKLIKFIVNNRNTKISELKLEIKKMKEDAEVTNAKFVEYVEMLNGVKKELENKIAEEKEHVKEVCEAIPNKKVKLLGEKFYGNSQAKTEEK